MISAEQQSKVAIFRAKALEGTLTLDEMREAVAIVREARRSAVYDAAASKSRAKKPTKSAEDLLAELGL